MKKNLMFMCFAGSLLLAGCSKDEVDVIPDPKPNPTPEPELVDVTFHATYSDATAPSSRALLDAGAIKWEGGELFSVNGIASKAGSTLADGVLDFTVEKLVKGATYNALYPAALVTDASKQYNAEAGTYTVTLPATQAWKDENSFTSGLCPAVASGKDVNLTFTSLCGVLKVTLKKAAEGATGVYNDITSARFTFGENDKVAGTATINPATKTLAIAAEGSSNVMDVTFAEAKSLEDEVKVVVYVVLPAGDYATGYKLELLKTDNTVVAQVDKTATPTPIAVGAVNDCKEVAVIDPVTTPPTPPAES